MNAQLKKMNGNGYAPHPNNPQAVLQLVNGWGDATGYPSDIKNTMGILLTVWVWTGDVGTNNSIKMQVLMYRNKIATRHGDNNDWNDTFWK